MAIEILNAYDPRAFTDALLRPTDDMDVALAMSGTDILTEFGADPQVERSIAAILDGLADCSLAAATMAHVDLTQRLGVLVGQRRRVVRETVEAEVRDGR